MAHGSVSFGLENDVWCANVRFERALFDITPALWPVRSTLLIVGTGAYLALTCRPHDSLATGR